MDDFLSVCITSNELELRWCKWFFLYYGWLNLLRLLDLLLLFQKVSQRHSSGCNAEESASLKRSPGVSTAFLHVASSVAKVLADYVYVVSMMREELQTQA